jgi:GNAT superfamily N-acetyltransferase
LVVSDLALHPRFIPQLTDGFFAEWPEWCARVGRPAVEAIFESGAGGALPVILVAHDETRAAGTVALRPSFAEEAMPETPWVRQFFVFPGHRGRGLDRLLGAAIERRARDLGFEHLYAATNRIEPLLRRRGWETFRTLEHEGQPMVWMRKIIGVRK